MAQRTGSAEIIRGRAAEAFAFLCEEHGFEGPERTDDGVAYHRPDLHIDFGLWAWKNEAGISTAIRRVDPVTGAEQAAELSRLYVECGLGPAQHVPGNLGGGHTVAKRVREHAEALRLLIPYVTGPTAAELFHRCRSGP